MPDVKSLAQLYSKFNKNSTFIGFPFIDIKGLSRNIGSIAGIPVYVGWKSSIKNEDWFFSLSELTGVNVGSDRNSASIFDKNISQFLLTRADIIDRFRLLMNDFHNFQAGTHTNSTEQNIEFYNSSLQNFEALADKKENLQDIHLRDKIQVGISNKIKKNVKGYGRILKIFGGGEIDEIIENKVELNLLQGLQTSALAPHLFSSEMGMKDVKNISTGGYIGRQLAGLWNHSYEFRNSPIKIGRKQVKRITFDVPYMVALLMQSNYFLKNIFEQVSGNIKGNFTMQVNQDGSQWETQSERTNIHNSKFAYNYRVRPSSKRIDGSSKPLRDTGNLYRSLTVQSNSNLIFDFLSNGILWYGSKVLYSYPHNPIRKEDLGTEKGMNYSRVKSNPERNNYNNLAARQYLHIRKDFSSIVFKMIQSLFREKISKQIETTLFKNLKQKPIDWRRYMRREPKDSKTKVAQFVEKFNLMIKNKIKSEMRFGLELKRMHAREGIAEEENEAYFKVTQNMIEFRNLFIYNSQNKFYFYGELLNMLQVSNVSSLDFYIAKRAIMYLLFDWVKTYNDSETPIEIRGNRFYAKGKRRTIVTDVWSAMNGYEDEIKTLEILGKSNEWSNSYNRANKLLKGSLMALYRKVEFLNNEFNNRVLSNRDKEIIEERKIDLEKIEKKLEDNIIKEISITDSLKNRLINGLKEKRKRIKKGVIDVFNFFNFKMSIVEIDNFIDKLERGEEFDIGRFLYYFLSSMIKKEELNYEEKIKSFTENFYNKFISIFSKEDKLEINERRFLKKIVLRIIRGGISILNINRLTLETERKVQEKSREDRKKIEKQTEKIVKIGKAELSVNKLTGMSERNYERGKKETKEFLSANLTIDKNLEEGGSSGIQTQSLINKNNKMNKEMMVRLSQWEHILRGLGIKSSYITSLSRDVRRNFGANLNVRLKAVKKFGLKEKNFTNEVAKVSKKSILRMEKILFNINNINKEIEKQLLDLMNNYSWFIKKDENDNLFLRRRKMIYGLKKVKETVKKKIKVYNDLLVLKKESLEIYNRLKRKISGKVVERDFTDLFLGFMNINTDIKNNEEVKV